MHKVHESLGEFFVTDAEEVVGEALATEDKEVVAAFERATADDPDMMARDNCADIVYRGRCGFADSGQWAYVRNLRRDRRVRATIEVTFSSSENRGRNERTKSIPAGGRVSLGCTKSATMPVTTFSFRLIGCEIL